MQTLGKTPIEFFGDNFIFDARVDVGPGHFLGLIMNKLEFFSWVGVFLMFSVVVGFVYFSLLSLNFGG